MYPSLCWGRPWGNSWKRRKTGRSWRGALGVILISHTWVAFFLSHPSNNNMSAEGMKCCHFMSPHQPITVSNCWLKLLQPVARSSKLSKFNFYALSTMPFDAILQPTLPPPTCVVLYVFLRKRPWNGTPDVLVTLFNVNFTKDCHHIFFRVLTFATPHPNYTFHRPQAEIETDWAPPGGPLHTTDAMGSDDENPSVQHTTTSGSDSSDCPLPSWTFMDIIIFGHQCIVDYICIILWPSQLFYVFLKVPKSRCIPQAAMSLGIDVLFSCFDNFPMDVPWSF